MTKPSIDASDLLHEYPLCDACLGRLMRHCMPDPMTNEERGRQLRSKTKKKAVSPQECTLCEGLMGEIPHFADLVEEELSSYEFSTFLLGCVLDEDIQEQEQKLWEAFQIPSPEPMKMEINRETGKILEPRLKKTVSFEHPEITVVLDTRFDVLSLQVQSLYMYGRYLKFQRDVPQTTWNCRICRGVGCRNCEFTGKMYPTSVEECIGQQAIEQAQAHEAVLHGAGREDIDACMLGTGRPFVLEVKHPKKRSIDLRSLEQQINKIHDGTIRITSLRWSTKDEIARLKQAAFRKQYRLTIEGKTPFIKEKLKEVAQILPGTIIQQFTPLRVEHRRAQKTRPRTIYHCTVESIDHASAVLTLETESGLYVKEFVSGDNGRTHPNLSELLGMPCTVTQLDVIDVKGE